MTSNYHSGISGVTLGHSLVQLDKLYIYIYILLDGYWVWGFRGLSGDYVAAHTQQPLLPGDRNKKDRGQQLY